MLFALVYVVIRRVLLLSGISSEAEAEVLVLRHELAVLCVNVPRACVAARPDAEPLAARLFEWELQHVPGERTRLTYYVDDA